MKPMHRRIFETATAIERARPCRRQPRGRYRYVRLRWHVLFAIVDALGGLIAWLARLIVITLRVMYPGLVTRSVTATKGEADPKQPPHKILLVQLDHLGDAVLSTVLLRGLRTRFPSADIEVLCGPWNGEFFCACPEVTSVHAMRSNRFTRGRRRSWLVSTLWWGWRLRRRRFDLAIDPRGEFPAALILWLSGARRRLGWACGGGGFLLTDTIRYVPGRHEVESRRALLRAIDDGYMAPRFDPGATARSQMAHRLMALHDLHSPLISVHVGAGTEAKRWPAASWRQLIGRLIVEHDARIVLVGQEADRQVADEILEGRAWPQVWDWTGRLSVVELAALMEASGLFLGADSGPAHLAAAVGTPAVVIFSGTNRPEQWHPWGEHVTVVRHSVPCSPCHREACYWADHPCMSRLSAAAVYAATVRQLSTIPQLSTLNPQPSHDRSHSQSVLQER